MTTFQREFMVRTLAESLGCGLQTVRSMADADIIALFQANSAAERLCTEAGSAEVEQINRYMGNAR